MAVWVRRTADRLTIRSIPVLGLVTAWSIAVGLLIPALLDWLGNNYRYPGARFWHVIAVILAGLMACSWRRLVVDRTKQSVSWRRRALLRRSEGRLPLSEITAVRLCDRPRLGPLARVLLRIETAADAVTLLFGWRWRDHLNEVRREALSALNEYVAVHDETAVGLLSAASADRKPFQLSLRRVLIATALVAGVLGASRAMEWQQTDAQRPVTMLVVCLILGAALLYRPGSAVMERFLPSLVAMYAPFVWIIFEIEPFGHISGLAGAIVWMPSIWIAVVTHNAPNGEWMHWVCCGMVLVEIGLAFACAARGWKWSLACTILLALLSGGASFILNAGIRM